MKQNRIFHRALSLFLLVAILAGFAVPIRATKASSDLPLEMEQIENSSVTAELPREPMGSMPNEASTGAASGGGASDDSMVRVSIQLEKAPTIDAGFEIKHIAQNAKAMRYRDSLKQTQDQLQATIERQALHGQRLDVVWNLTLAANMISANVPRSAIEKIAALDGVKAVVEETCYQPQVVSVGGEYRPDMAVSGQMTGACQAWLEGYTGAGRRIAVIDTGLDTDHQSFSPSAFAYALDQASKEKGIAYQLLDAEEIGSVMKQLNAYQRATGSGQSLSAADLYINSKAAFGYNYIDGDLDVTHDHDDQGEHGSHVAGIAAANRYLEQGGAYVDAMEEVQVAGNAPDAQLLVMKVFGKNGGAFDSDIMVAIEDAMILGADAVNLSLGSSSAGTATIEDSTYRALMERVVESGMVVVTSAGNDGYWSMYSTGGYLYSDDVNYDTVGSPGSYASSLAVASVDNDGIIGPSLVVDGNSMGYMESLVDSYGYAFGNAAISTLDTSPDGSGTPYDFVLVDGYGTADDYTGIDLAGKIVLCSRGGDYYYYEKANTAAELGAAALVVYNNEAGVLYMDLSGYNHSMPAVFISQSHGAVIKSAATEQVTEDGRTYFTGQITVRSRLSGNYENSDYKTMSSFSSWGVPGDLSIKPEITAPGGNIYSVNGAASETDQYELMSGTSMSSPQVAGMVALVKQYLQEQDIHVSGLNERGLTQALLMSTAEPMHNGSNGNYYSVFQQGAGLANVSAVLRTPAYLTVDGAADGRVKVELGDDPTRTGVYTFRLQLNNLTQEPLAYQLYADAFTQNVFQDEAGNACLDTLTRTLEADVDFAVNGASLSAPSDRNANFDFNGDGRVTRADGQLLLDHVTLGTELTANADYADVSGDGQVNTYDVHQFLRLYQGAVEVPASGSVTVDVTMTLTSGEKAKLDAENPNGAYVEAFIQAVPLATADGELLPTLSVPVLGFYGNWSDASMFDVGTQITHATGEEPRSSYLGNPSGNAVGVVYGDNPRQIWYFGGNPIVPDEHYLPQRNAINTARGDFFYQWSFAPIRSAAATRFTAVNTTTGESLAYSEGGPVTAAFYYPLYATWMGTPQYLELGLHPDVEVGESGLLSLTLAPEYYVHNGVVDWDALGHGATMEVPFTVDVEDPQILEVKVDTEHNVMLVTASDDQYLAGVLLYDVTGRKLLKSVGTTPDAKPGETITFSVPLDGVAGYKFIIQTADYAANFATYQIRETVGDPEPLPTRLAFDENLRTWSTFHKEDYYWNTSKWFDSDIAPVSATAVGEYALICDEGGKLYAVPVDDMLSYHYIRKLEYVLTDMAYDASTDTVYGVTGSGLLVSVNKWTGELTELGNIGIDTNTLANDGKGTFYCFTCTEVQGSYRLDLYSFTLDESGNLTSPVLVGSPYTGYAKSSGISTMEYDPVNQILCLFARIPGYSYDYSYYYEIDPAPGNSLLTDYYPPTPFTKSAVALIFPQWGEGGSAWTEPTDQVASVGFSRNEMEVLIGLTAQLHPEVLPWNLTDKNVIYSSADETIATVDGRGIVTGVGLGTTTIRATSVLDSTVYATCTVHVKQLSVTVNGILRDSDKLGTPKFYTWNMETGDPYVVGNTLKNPPMAVTRVPETDTFYLLDAEHGTMHLLDQDGKDLVEPADHYYQQNYWIWDLAYSPYFSTEDTPAVYGIRENAIIAPTNPMNPQFANISLGKYGVSFLAGIAAGGCEHITYKNYYGYDAETDSEVVYLIDDQCNVWRCNMFLEDGYRYNFVYSVIPSDMEINYPAGFSGRSSLVIGEDGALYFSAWVGSTNALYRLVYDESSETYLSTLLGDFGQDVWPAVILDATSNAPAAAVPPQGSTLYLQSEPEADGTLHAVQVEETESQLSPGIQTDRDQHTITVPIVATESTNGLFHVEYDPDALALVSVNPGAVLNRYDTSTAGKIRMGYADANEINGVIANLVFRYTPGDEVEETDLILSVVEDGATSAGTTEAVKITLPEDPFPERFEDVQKGDWFYDDVKFVYNQGLMVGVSETRFAPNATANRAMIATVLYRLAGTPTYTTENPYTDLKQGSYYYDAVLWCTENGIFEGYGNGKFGPMDAVTREQLAVVLYRYTEKYLDMDASSRVVLKDVYRDYEKISRWAEDGMSWASATGLMEGYPDGTVRPRNGEKRSEIAAMFHRYCVNILDV